MSSSWPGFSKFPVRFSKKASQVVLVVKNQPANAGYLREMGSSKAQPLGGEDLLEEGMVTYSSILAWRIPWIEEPSQYGPWDHRVRHNWSDLACMHAPIFDVPFSNTHSLTPHSAYHLLIIPRCLCYIQSRTHLYAKVSVCCCRSSHEIFCCL